MALFKKQAFGSDEHLAKAHNIQTLGWVETSCCHLTFMISLLDINTSIFENEESKGSVTYLVNGSFKNEMQTLLGLKLFALHLREIKGKGHTYLEILTFE